MLDDGQDGGKIPKISQRAASYIDDILKSSGVLPSTTTTTHSPAIAPAASPEIGVSLPDADLADKPVPSIEDEMLDKDKTPMPNSQVMGPAPHSPRSISLASQAPHEHQSSTPPPHLEPSVLGMAATSPLTLNPNPPPHISTHRSLGWPQPARLRDPLVSCLLSVLRAA